MEDSKVENNYTIRIDLNWFHVCSLYVNLRFSKIKDVLYNVEVHRFDFIHYIQPAYYQKKSKI